MSKLIRSKNPRKLEVELLPSTVRDKSLFQIFNKERRLDEWKAIKDELLYREGSMCWICEKKSSSLHVAEYWDFDEDNKTMILTEIHHLCDMCYKIKRSDFWFFTEYGKEQLKQLNISPEDLVKHYCRVNKCELKDFGKNWREAIDTWKERSRFDWKQDFGDII